MKPLHIAAAFLAIALLAPSAARAVPVMETLTETQVGIDGTALSTSPTTSIIAMGGQTFKSELLFQMFVTPGDSTTVTVTCEEGWSRTLFTTIAFRPEASPATMVQDSEVYTVDGSITNWSIHIVPRAPFVRCTFTGAGTATLIVRGVLNRV